MSKNAAGYTYFADERDVKTALNTRLDEISDSVRGMTTKSVAGSGNYTLLVTDQDPEARRSVINLTGTLTGARTVLIPTNEALRVFIIYNNTTGNYDLTVKTTAGGSTGVVVRQGSAALVWHDGTNVYSIEGSTTSWTAPTLLNSWANFGSGYQTAGYRKIGDRVELKGLVTGGTIASVIFTLPAGYRPSAICLFAADTGNAHGRVEVASNGNVSVTTGTTGTVGLDGIYFSTQ